MLKVREFYCPAHFGNSFEVASQSEMREILQETKWWGFNAYSDWFNTMDLYDVYAKRGIHKLYNMPEAIWEKKFINYETASELGFELGLVLTPNHVFSDQLNLGKQAEQDPHIFGQLLCPSDTASRKIILKNVENLLQDFKRRGLSLKRLTACPYDYGGCACAECAPWIITFGKLCREVRNMAENYFPGIEMSVITWWWSEEEYKLFAEWSDKEARNCFQGMYLHLPYGEYAYKEHPLPQGCRERAFVHVSYGEEAQPCDAYGHLGPVMAPLRMQNTVEYLFKRKAEGFMTYCEGTHADINVALLGGLSSGRYSKSHDALAAYAKRYLGGNAEEWADWISAWGKPFAVDVENAGRTFERLKKNAAPSWRLEQLESKLKLFEANHRVLKAEKWDGEKTQAARDFWLEKERLWRKTWGLGLTRHILRFNSEAPNWQKEYLEACGKIGGNLSVYKKNKEA